MQTRDLKQRIVTLLEKEHLLSAIDIVKKLENSENTYHKTSVYRAMDQLVENGTVCEHNFSGKESVYEMSSHHHTHLYCSSCGNVSVGSCDYKQPQKVGEFVVDHHHITLIGTCQNCQN